MAGFNRTFLDTVREEVREFDPHRIEIARGHVPYLDDRCQLVRAVRLVLRLHGAGTLAVGERESIDHPDA